MANSSITNKDIIGWTVTVAVSLIPLIIFYLEYRTNKRKSQAQIENLEDMIYKQELALKELENKALKKENADLQKENEELKKKLAAKD